MAKPDGSVVINTRLNADGFGKGAANLKSQFTKLASSASKISGVAVAAFGVAIAGITKNVVKAYADYEQLIGGVETLFGDAGKKVAQNAENAFYTVGMSANEYMETVTGFSASLISSLSGDTAKAADVADMALTDMADNANKMGTSLEAVKTAYQGFAKQQYMLLDNLKLGYGGTKTEMERLLKDAEKLTGQKYDINNLADVYDAIHAIQVEMGIAGTTAKEAEKTITGSANMTKAAWQNVLKALGGGGDLEAAINNLVFSITKLFQNVMPVVERALAGIGQLIEQAAPALVETVAAALIKAIPSLVNAIYYMIIGLAKGIYEGIVALFSGTTRTIEKQLTDTKGIADNNKNAADSAEKLADEIEKAGKAAKKALAGFDELNILTSSTAAEEEQNDMGKSSSGSVISALRAETEKAASPLLRFINLLGDKIAKLFIPLKKINIKPALKALKNIGVEAGKIFEQVWNVVSWIWTDALAPIAQFWAEEIAPRSLESLSGIFRILGEVITPVVNSIDDFKVAIAPITEWIGAALVECLDKINVRFDSLAKLFEEKTPEMERLMKNLGIIVEKLWGAVGPILTMIKDQFMVVFDFVADLLETTIGKAIDALTGFTDFIVGVLTGDWEAAFNGLIDVLNSAISFVIGGVNDMIKALNDVSKVYPDWWPNKDKLRLNIPTIPIPQIPYLAKGAVIPPNAPFMAMLGDQRHGTNIEAPLSTIQDAVRAELGSTEDAIIAAAEAVIERQERILSAIESIEIGDTTIGQAALRYNRRMAITNGGI